MKKTLVIAVFLSWCLAGCTFAASPNNDGAGASSQTLENFWPEETKEAVGRQDYREAYKILQVHQERLKGQPEKRLEHITILGMLGQASSSFQETDKSRQYFLDALSEVDGLKNLTPYETGYLEGFLANENFQKSQGKTNTVQYQQQLIDLLRAKLLVASAEADYRMKKLESAYQLAQKAHEIFTRYPDSNLIAYQDLMAVHRLMAEWSKDHSDYPQAESHVKQAIEVINKCHCDGDQSVMNALQESLAFVKYHSGDQEQAFQIIKQLHPELTDDQLYQWFN